MGLQTQAADGRCSELAEGFMANYGSSCATRRGMCVAEDVHLAQHAGRLIHPYPLR